MTAIERGPNILGYKHIKKILKITLYTIVTLTVAMAVFAFSLQFPIVQTFVSQRVAKFLSKELNADISINAVYFKPFSSLTLHDLTIKDPQGQRIVSTKRLYANLKLTQLFSNKIDIKELQLTEAFLDYRIYLDSSNFSFLMNYFVPKQEIGDPPKKSLKFSLNKLVFENCHFILVDERKEHHNKGIDFSDIELTEFSGILDHIRLDTASNQVHIHNLHFKEKSGLHLQNLSTKAEIGNRFMAFDDFTLQTNRSLLKRHLRFDYDSFGDFSDFIQKVHITADMTESFVDSKDIEFFAPSMQSVRFTTSIHRAELSGTVADITAKNVHFGTREQTVLQGDFTIKGLPNMDKTIFDFQNISLTSSPNDVEYLVPELANRATFKLPEQLHELGIVHFNGDFVGLYNDFTVDGTFDTNIGILKTKSFIDIKKSLTYNGILQSSSLDMAKFLKNSDLGNTEVDLTFSGKNTDLASLELNFEGELHRTQIKDLTMRSIALEGTIQEQRLNVNGFLNDARAQLDYDLQIDWNTTAPTYTIESNVEYLNLSALNLVNRDSIILKNTVFKTTLTGDNINNLSGYVASDEIHLSTYKGSFVISDFRFEAEGDQTNRQLSLQSNVLDAQIRGIIDLNTIEAYFQSMAMQYAPAIGFERQAFNDQNFDLDVNIKSFAPVSTFLDESLVLDDGAYLKANFSSDNYIGNFIFFTPNILYKGIRLHNLTIHENVDEQAFSLDVNADRLHLSDSIYVENISLENILANDSLHFKIRMANDTEANYLRLNGNIYFEHNRPAYIHFDESILVVNGDHWTIHNDTDIQVSKGKFYFDSFKFSQAEQVVELNGILSNEDEQLMIDFSRFGLASLEAITKPLGINLRGELNGQVTVTSALKSPQFKANINTSPITYNDLPIGQLDFHADYNPTQDLIELKLNLLDELNRGVKLEGTYNLVDKDNALQVSGSLQEIELIIFQPFLKTLVDGLSGRASGDIKIGGNLKNPKFSGLARIHHVAFTVIYLNTPYTLSEQTAMIDRNVVMFSNLRIHDTQRNEAVANGYLDLNQLSDPNIDVDAKANNFMVLNTTYKENNLYYGTAFATGVFRFKGRTSGINIDISATSNPNTVIHIPFNSAMTVSESDFIYFVEADSTKVSQRENSHFLQGLTMNMDLLITPDAEMNLQTDIGSLKGTGTGQVTLRISSLGDFEMFGDYTVNSGNFHFTAQDFINKYFDIKQGGTIRWTGDPSNASINLTAIYQQRTSIGALYNAAGRSGQEDRVLAQADMIITGTLSQPDISFDLNFPLNPYVKDELQAYLSDINNVNQQALSLIVRRSFTASSNNEFGREVNNTLLSAGTEIAFNQLNAIISQSLNVNFLDLNIRSLNDASASLRLFNDRLVITGGISDLRNVQNTDLTFFSNRIATDAELTYRIRRDGSLMFRAYNRLNTRNMLFTPTDDYINAVGLIYRQEFNTFSEFFRRMMMIRRRENRPPPTTTVQDTVSGK